MSEPQAGIFDRDYTEHLFMEYVLGGGHDPERVRQALRAARDAAGERTPVLMAFGPGLWRRLDRHFDFPPFAMDGRMPATQGDLLIWIQADTRSALFDTGVVVHRALKQELALQLEVDAFVYHDLRDLTGFVDGIGNPQGERARQAAIIAEPHPAAGGSWVLTQKWVHSGLERFHALPVDEQEKVFGRTKADAVEFDDERMPDNAHVGRTDVDRDGVPQKIWRRSVPFGTPSEHGLYFIAFSCELDRFDYLMRRMTGLQDGVHDRLMEYTEPVTGSWWYAPSRDWLATL